jgi:2,3-bisphosphoglycerate-independent phosphoglycerate mutase
VFHYIRVIYHPVVSWTPLTNLTEDADVIFTNKNDDNDDSTVNEAINVLRMDRSSCPDLIFVHLDGVDHAGHCMQKSLQI